MSDLFSFPAKRGMSSHHKIIGNCDIWLTPPEIIKGLGSFDLDPCAAPDPRPWETAKHHYNERDNGLILPWHGRVWMNPPYDHRVIGSWLGRLADHGNGVALIYARTETEIFHKFVWNKADAILFFKGRLTFYKPCGDKAAGNGGAPSCLVAYGPENARSLIEANYDNPVFAGKYVKL